MIPNRNALWGSIVVQELARHQVRHVAMAPGSRSTPLVLAFQAEPAIRLTTHLDERSAGFLALGAAKATQRPCAIVTTSGTAAANLLPAVVEASQSRVPLLALTADRPPELQDVGANQTIDQHGLYGGFVRWFADAGLPEPRPETARHLRALVGRAVAYAQGPPAGPVHLNFPFREPLEPRHVPQDVPPDWHGGDVEAAQGRSDDQPYLVGSPPMLQPDPASLSDIARWIRACPRGLIVCGPRDACDDFPAEVAELARRTGYPILADPLSGLRFGAPADVPVLSAYDAFLPHAAVRRHLDAEFVLRFGAAPTSRALLTYLSELPGAHHVFVDETGRHWDPTNRGRLGIAADPASVCRELASALPAGPAPDAAWAQKAKDLERETWRVLERELRTRPFEGAFAAHLVEALPAHATLFVSSSLPVRDVDRFARTRPQPLRVLANRGASGIDGVLSTALGAAHALERRVALLIGDLAFLHDLGGLLSLRRLGIPLDVFVVNNDGGGIFEFLPIAQFEPPFTELFVTPHGLDLETLARAFALRHHRVAPDEPVRPGDGPAQLVEITSDRKANAAHRREVDRLVGDALAAFLEAPVSASTPSRGA